MKNGVCFRCHKKCNVNSRSLCSDCMTFDHAINVLNHKRKSYHCSNCNIPNGVLFRLIDFEEVWLCIHCGYHPSIDEIEKQRWGK